ncbi:MAG: hypothetical protein GXO20_03135 [Thermodesulfobacteria bacterium]|nr:hypothetical protein [Thermodesulfobacteriota bacterium]
MKGFRILPLLVGVAFLKLLLTGAYFWGVKGGKLNLTVAEARASAEKETSEEGAFCCPEALFEALRLEKEKLRQERLALEKRKKDLALLEEQVRRRLATLKSLEEELDKKLNELREIKTKRFKLLVGAYGTMKPSKAARLIEAMEPEMAIKILSALKTDQVARILSAMPPEKAASLAEALSGLPPREL